MFDLKTNSVSIRQLQRGDLRKGFLETLDSFRQTSIDDISAEKIFDKINSNSEQIIIVAIINENVVGSATLLIETKFIHNGGLVGHIEDVVVNKGNQKREIGKKMVTYLLDYAKEKGCYKTILNCVDDIKPFYEKLGFKHNANALRFDHV